jgi:hypothetical protein
MINLLKFVYADQIAFSTLPAMFEIELMIRLLRLPAMSKAVVPYRINHATGREYFDMHFNTPVNLTVTNTNYIAAIWAHHARVSVAKCSVLDAWNVFVS